jgi:hypothetical protein
MQNLNENVTKPEDLSKEPTDQAPELKPGESLAVINNGTGAHEMIRGEKGRFKRSANIEKQIERSQLKHDRFLQGKAQGKATDRETDMLHKMYELSMGETDAKNLGNIVKAHDLMLTRSSVGKVPTREEQQGPPIRIVVISTPDLMHPELIEEKPKPPLVPSWMKADKECKALEGEYVDSKE